MINQKGNTTLIAVVTVALLGVVLFLMFKPFEVVDTGNMGLYFKMGALQDEVRKPGINWKTPFVHRIKEVTIQPIQVDYEIAVDSNGAITKDNQTVGAKVTLFYKYDENRLVEMWRQFGEDKLKGIVVSTVKENVKEVIGTYDIFEIAQVRDEITGKVWEKVLADLVDYPVVLTELKMVNYDWSTAFDTQIEATMKRAQEVKQKQQELLIAEQEAQKQVKVAEAEKTATVTRAEGKRDAALLEAEAKAAEGDGIRKYNQAVQSNWAIEKEKINLEIEKIKAEAWNGQYVSQVHYGPIPVQTGNILGVK